MTAVIRSGLPMPLPYGGEAEGNSRVVDKSIQPKRMNAGPSLCGGGSGWPATAPNDMLILVGQPETGIAILERRGSYRGAKC